MVFGYASLPYVDYKPALLSACRPVYQKETSRLEVKVENFGLSVSQPAEVEIICEGTSLGKAAVDALQPYESKVVQLNGIKLPNEKGTYEVVFYTHGKETERNVLPYFEEKKK